MIIKVQDWCFLNDTEYNLTVDRRFWLFLMIPILTNLCFVDFL